jgi:hypothetical protein
LNKIFSDILLAGHSIYTMAVPVVEFSRQGYKMRKVFGKKSTLFK